MTTIMQTLRALPPLFACLALALVAGTATAQTDDERWYQVELIVFAQGSSPDEGEEVWRPDITLSYPSNWLELVDPDQADLDEDGMQAPGVGERQLGERALALLPAEEFTLRREAQRLERDSRYRILFQGAWRQPLAENRQEPAILITGGEQFDDHYELEGSVQLSLRTYLHIDTNLWLSQFNTNFGQEREPWPQLPRRPNQVLDTDTLFRWNGGSSRQWQSFNQSWDYEAILAQPYVVENIVQLKQSRRMRSGELHYIDHPRMGLLVKLIPYEPEVSEDE